MNLRIISAYISHDDYVITICRGESYRFTHRLKEDVNNKLLNAVLEARVIETSRWVKL